MQSCDIENDTGAGGWDGVGTKAALLYIHRRPYVLEAGRVRVGGESQFYLDPETQASVGPRLLSGLDTVGAGCGVRGDIRTRRSRPVKVQLERSASKGYPCRSECDWSSRCVCKNIDRFSL